MDEDKFGEISGSIGEDYDLLMALRGLYDWSVLADLSVAAAVPRP